MNFFLKKIEKKGGQKKQMNMWGEFCRLKKF